MRIAFLGYGKVGAPLADHLQRLGHDVTLAAADDPSDKVKEALSRNGALNAPPPERKDADAEHWRAAITPASPAPCPCD
jgi:3-hydroxyisobutyrate dehydrogenase-like beta-hydroxyacid dehydrogenase